MASEGSYVTVISAFMAARRRGEPLQIHGDGEQTRDFTHVSDIVAANILAMDARIADGRPINVGAGHNVSINRIADLIGGKRVCLERRKGDMRDTLADTTEASRILEWRPGISVEEGIERLLASERPG